MSTTSLRDPLTLALLADVRADSLMPAEQPTSPKLLVSADTYQQRLLKYPHRATFHSYAEFIHALLLEARADVRSFVPQPFVVWFRGRRYIPDCFVLEHTGAVVVELKAKGVMREPPPEVVQRFFDYEKMSFRILANEEILAREAEALHWLRLIQVLVVANQYGVDTRNEELELLQQCTCLQTPCVGDLISPRRHGQLSQLEIALYRLLHQHRLEADLATRALDYDSELRLCA